jgi:hypothetical protein
MSRLYFLLFLQNAVVNNAGKGTDRQADNRFVSVSVLSVDKTPSPTI